MLYARDIVSVIELIFYIPTAILALFVCFRHGFNRSSGWIYTLILCTVRIAGAICQFISHNNHSTGLITATIVIDSIGLTPLIVYVVNAKTTTLSTTKHFRIVLLLITVGLILSIVGGTTGNYQSDGTQEIPTTSKVGVILFIIAFAGIVIGFLTSVKEISVVPKKERRVPVAIAFALPLVLVRLVYSACVVFGHNHLFNLITGSVAVLVMMSVIEEFLVVAIYICLGFLLDTLDKGTQRSRVGWESNRDQGGMSEAQRLNREEYQMVQPPSPVRSHGAFR
ncbi:uncharacterized protein K460DRAFT_407506 [Cucurbitaria berberidis CBS 394.84]|uniref:DUF7702 domain-containing protein n=1 Tax=Cucurbitaria berberidis CBS 394.84 TaxID=1168544 RepID=A0A9P4L5N4_9PLEO|nr:uncharacterized protein K460DRAFT_407506 [Cucurbitaria berberidis CBS 394.84]KAF1843141.1 hypothetical protein K460DRAFT_407506 [Cucurbitaria berberidis CBS 394.84]